MGTAFPALRAGYMETVVVTRQPKPALYIRVSSLDQNPEAQRRELEIFARRHGWEVVAVFEDKASGADPNRPAMAELLSAVRAGTVDCVLCWKLDRFGRSLVDCLDKLHILEIERCRFIATSQGIDTGDGYANATATFFLNVLACAAEFERAMIRERMLSGLARYREDLAAGKVGKTVHSQSGKDLPPSRPKKVIDIERIMALRAQGWTVTAIARELRASRATVGRRLQAAVRSEIKRLEGAAQPGQDYGK